MNFCPTRLLLLFSSSSACSNLIVPLSRQRTVILFSPLPCFEFKFQIFLADFLLVKLILNYPLWRFQYYFQELRDFYSPIKNVPIQVLGQYFLQVDRLFTPNLSILNPILGSDLFLIPFLF